MSRWGLAIALALAAGCFKPTYESGKFQCSPKGECPSGYACAAGICYANGAGPDLAIGPDMSNSGDLSDAADLAPPPDLVQVDLVAPPIIVAPAAVWNSSGGGVTTATSNSTLSLSIGGSVVGSATAQGSASATMTFGKLGTAR